MKNIHEITDNAFSKAWEVNCPNCKAENPNRILFFRKKCNDCVTKDMAERMYSEEDMIKFHKWAYLKNRNFWTCLKNILCNVSVEESDKTTKKLLSEWFEQFKKK